MSDDPASPVFSPVELAAWTGGDWEHAPPAGLRGVGRDGRAPPPGGLYVALAGERFDGHDFVAQALAGGAAAALVRRGWVAGAARPLLRVGDTRLALAAAAAGYRRAVAPHITGVTGSAGKTTVKEWLAALLATQQPTAATRGNYNNDIGLPLSLLAMPRGTRDGVFEVGMNHPGELAPLCRLLAPDAGVITAIGPVHLEFFPSVQAIADEKAALLRELPARGFAVLDADSPHFAFLRAQTVARVITVGLEAPGADYRAAALDEAAGAFTVTERATGVAQALRTGLPGRHNALNALLAVAAARARGVPWPAIAAALPRLPRPAMRWERRDVGGVAVVNDAYNANPLAMACALRTFEAVPCAGRRLLALGEMRELGAASDAAHEDVGRQVAGGTCALLVAVGAAGGRMADAAARHGFRGAIVRVADAAAAGAVLAARARPGDAVLLKASRGVRLEEALEAWRRQAAGPGGGGDC